MKKINARNCIVKSISNNELYSFLENYHLQKSAKSFIQYGLFYNDELLQVMSFNRPRFNKNYQWEIIRECTKKDYIVRGGTSKLWKHFLKYNSCYSCICYHYPHNLGTLFTEHLIKYCNFKNIKKAHPEKKIYFEGEWNGKYQRIDKSILERHGVDKLLKTKQGQDRTNEQILLDLGFKKRYENGYSPQIDIYYPFNVLYRIEDLDTNDFYVGITENEEIWNNNYMGSGSLWKRHLNKYPDIEFNPSDPNAHKYKRIILKKNFKTPNELYKAELNEIKKYCIKYNGQLKIDHTTGCLNLNYQTKNYNFKTGNPCPECGNRSIHKKSCKFYKTPKYKRCPECNSVNGHFDWCSQSSGKCPECGYSLRAHRHAKTCSHYKPYKKSQTCPECGGGHGLHKQTCSQYKKPKKAKCCSICGSPNNHKKWCKFYKKSKRPESCPECGTKNLSRHKVTCSHYKPLDAVCPECGTKNLGQHKKGCSKYRPRKVCPECGSKNLGQHKKGCSKFKYNYTCPECKTHNKGAHKKGCPNSKQMKQNSKQVCPECGWGLGQHSISCKYDIKCPECKHSLKYEEHSNSCKLNPKNIYNKNGYCKYCGNHKQSHIHKKDCFVNQRKKVCTD